MDNQSVQIFQNPEFGNVRVIELDGEVWFVAKDVASTLGYKDTDKAIRNHVDDDDKKTYPAEMAGQVRHITIINESGLYSLILGSKLESAKRFKRWVTSEVLPSIRKHGLYATDELISNPDLLIKVATELKEERQKRLVAEETIQIQDQKIAELQPKATYYDAILCHNDAMSITEIAMDYGMTAQQMNKTLKSLDVQYKLSGRGIWILKAPYKNLGYAVIQTLPIYDKEGKQVGVREVLYWTQKGRLFLYHLLKKYDLLPLVERKF